MPQPNPTIQTPQSGMIGDLHKLNRSSKQYNYALNAVMGDFTGENFLIQNEQSNLLEVVYPEGFKVNGLVEIFEQNRTLVTLVNESTGESEFGQIIHCSYEELTDTFFQNCYGCNKVEFIERTPLELLTQKPFCVYIPIVRSNCFGFDINYRVDMEYLITDCGINVYFTDFLNQRRFLYFSYLNNDPSQPLIVRQEFYTIIGYDAANCNAPIYSDEIDCNKIKVHPCYMQPCSNLVNTVTFGNLKAGVYQYLISYATKEGEPLNQYTPGSNPIPLSNKRITIDTAYNTGMGITIDINKLDGSTYSYFNLVVAETIDNFTEFKYLGTYPINAINYSFRYTHTGNEKSLQTFTADEVFARTAFYEKARLVTKANNYLFYGGLTEFKIPNLQRAVSRIPVYWATSAVPEGIYSKADGTFRMRSLMRDEVYPVGIVLEFCNGLETPVLPFIGRAPKSSDLTTVNNTDTITTTYCGNSIVFNKRWQVYNTASIIATPHQETINCENPKIWEWGECAYWESSEKYDNDFETWGELCGQPIRHPKMPDSTITHIHDRNNVNLNNSHQDNYKNNNIIYPLGLKIDHNDVVNALQWAVQNNLITQAERNTIRGYRIVRGNRANNKSIEAKGMLYDVWNYEKSGNTYYYPNFPLNDLRQNYFIAPTANTYKGSNTSTPTASNFTPTKRYTFHSPDTSFVSAGLGSVLKLETEEYGSFEGQFALCDGQAKQQLFSTFAMTLALAIGAAAAISATERKECVTYTYKADYRNTDKDAFNYVGEGGATTNNLSAGTVTFGTGTSGTSGNINTKIDAKKHDTSIGTQKEEHNNPFSNLQNPQSLKSPLNQFTKKDVDNYTQTECQGEPMQIFGEMGAFLGKLIYRSMLGIQEMQLIVELLKKILPIINYSVQFNSVGKYNAYVPVANNGFKQRSIERSAYLSPIIQSIDEAISVTSNQYSTILFNNWHRESSVYLKYAGAFLPNPTHEDRSRFTLDSKGIERKKRDQTLDQKFYDQTSSYYAALKNYVPDQYGKISNIEFIETSGCSFDLNYTGEIAPQPFVFGGDTFITRFGLKRKHSFFLQTRFDYNDQSDVTYSDLGNVGYPNYFIDTAEGLFENVQNEASLLGIFSSVLGVPDTRLDAKTSKAFYQNGYIHLYSYGIPYFLVESDINVDFRHGENNLEKDYYPHQGDINFWLQEKNVSPREDNFYFYNTTYSKQNKESFLLPAKETYKDNCEANLGNRVIYSLNDDLNITLRDRDSFNIFKANNFYDFPLSDGRLVSIDGIENDKVLARLENITKIFNAYNLIQTDETNIQVDTGGIFQSRPKSFAVTDLGYAGTQHIALLNTEFGHFSIDAKRGAIFNLGLNATGLEEISVTYRNWFKENLPFQLKRDFPNIADVDLDNSFKNVGIVMCFDKRFSRILITKLDYKVLDKRIVYDPESKTFTLTTDTESILVNLTDKKYFCDKSWTISYDLQNKAWTSFHSYKPNYYIHQLDTFSSGIQKKETSTLWRHNVTNKSYQVFYGKLHPFIIDYTTEQSVATNFVTAIQFQLDVLRYHNEYDYFFNNQKTFNKAVVYNDRQSSGLLELIPNNEEDLSTIGMYPNTLFDRTQVSVTNSDNYWNFNDFTDLARSQNNNIPLWLNTCANDLKTINSLAIDYQKSEWDRGSIRARQNNVRLINDKHSNYKMIMLFSIINQNQSLR